MFSQRSWLAFSGNSQKLDGGAMFGHVPKALWQRWLPADEYNRVALACRCLLVCEPDGRLILLETGVGAFFSPEMKERYGIQEERDVLLEQLAVQGICPTDIDVIILSHVHFDHAGGVLSAWSEGGVRQLNFPNASYVLSRAAWQRAQHPHVRDRASFVPELIQALADLGCLHLVEDCLELPSCLPSDYRFHRSDGHTPGMLLTEIPFVDGPLLFAADLIPGLPWMHVPLSMGYDRFPELVSDEKEKILKECLTRDVKLFFTHDPRCACARVTCDEKGRYVGEPYTSSIQGYELNPV